MPRYATDYPVTSPVLGTDRLQAVRSGEDINISAADIAALAAGGGGTGDVVGPASSVNNRVAVFSGTTGKLLADGGQTLAELIASAKALNVQTVVSAATVTPTFANDMVKITAQAVSLTLANPTGAATEGWGIVVRIKDNGTARAISYGTQYRAATGVTLPTTTVAGQTIYIAMIFNQTDTRWDVLSVGTVT